MREIVIKKVVGGFHVKANKTWGFGVSLDEALGEMLRVNSAHFGFKLIWDKDDPMTSKFLESKKRKRRKKSKTIKLNPKKGVF